MDNRGKNIRKLIEENFSKKEDKDEDEYEEDTLVKRSVNDFLDEKIEEFPNDDDFFNFNVFRRKSFPGDDFLASNTYAGKTISRKSWEEESESDDEYDDQDTSDLSESSEVEKESKKNKRVTFASDYEDLPTKSKKVTFASADEEIPKRSKKVTFATNDEEIINKTKRAAFPKLPNELEKDDEEISSEDGEDIEDQAEESQGDEDEESSDDEAQDSEDEKESGEEESDIEDDLSEEEVDTSFVYSKEIREESNDLEKGKAIRNQLSLCELLLESRITLQKALFASNQLPKPDNYQNIWAECSEEGKSTMIQCREKVWDLLEKLIHLQCHFRKQCPEFMKTLDETTVKQYEELNETEPTIKRRKLSEYPAILNDLHNHYKPYRNNEIQKWNDRTKAAYGKLAKKDFSAFDLPITKQIDQILADKERLIHRTHIKRANYKIVGEKDPADEGNEEKSEQNSNLDYDEEIYDDDDFYHKLLRDYIERKTADVSDPTQLGRKWIQLQSLRSKMKRKIDTRRTKGRKIKFDVHTKLVNFMAPIINHNSYTDTAVNELYNSIFGKGLINS